MEVKIIEPHNKNTGWITFIAHDRWIQAKVYDEPSTYGVNDGRVSKLCVAKKGIHLLGSKSGLNFFENLDYNYDRGLDFKRRTLLKKELNDILNWLEMLPKLFEED